MLICGAYAQHITRQMFEQALTLPNFGQSSGSVESMTCSRSSSGSVLKRMLLSEYAPVADGAQRGEDEPGSSDDIAYNSDLDGKVESWRFEAVFVDGRQG